MFLTLISPPMVASYESGFYTGRRGGPPLNLAYLARVAHDCGVAYDVIDSMAQDGEELDAALGVRLAGLSLDAILERIDLRTSVIGITAMFTSEWLVVRELCRRIRARFPGVVIVLGGEHASADAENIITYEPSVDFCFLGEAEDSFAAFLKSFPAGTAAEETPGVVFRDANGNVRQNPRPARIRVIDDLFPLWDRIPVRYYLDRGLSYSRLGTRAMPLLATRGCPYACTFCTNQLMWGQRYVMRSVDSVVREMKEHVELLQVEHFDFIDLATSVNRRWFEALLKRIIAELPGVSWEMTVGTRAEILDHEILKLVKESGNHIITYAPETGSISMARKIRKKLDFGHFYTSVKSAVKLGLGVKANIIIGFPGETPLELFSTLFMSLKLGFLGVKGVSIFRFTPFPGSELAAGTFPKVWPTRENYEKMVQSQLGTGGAKVLSVAGLFRNPGDQYYALLSNSAMVLSYGICVLRRPRYIGQFFRNLRTGRPTAPVEVAVYSILRKYGLVT